ncbi:hypothetical protein DWF00_00785 [Bosea caraganae]|uniref:Activator of Hsp90 ATPase homologue 1/2-like C-terminal domain-containing protein n=1 Tax=Bosea caraganae TaxID=2763117 RepID=A0A370L901_9HYPH|nr:SRPBCC family protein [Bosea caraganae]RDJ26747.1 hypothetical protein DWE98_07800 [Bosea caraganae]RDJ30634.1 hypothetical protein DWF00_00785 [Bosea caraganae]
MSERSVTHATFTIERLYDASRTRVFAAWAEPAAKQRWFACHGDWTSGPHQLDFAIGGREHLSTRDSEGVDHIYDAIYQDIIPGERIVYAYQMHLGTRRISVSLATVEFRSEGKGTRLVFTEQAAFLDGYDRPDERKLGTRAGLENLAAELQRQAAAA